VNPAIPYLGSRKLKGTSADQILSGVTHIAVPVRNAELLLNSKLKAQLEKNLGVDLTKEIKDAKEFTSKTGEIIEIRGKTDSTKVLLVGVGEGTIADQRKVGSVLGRRIKSTSAKLLSLLPATKVEAIVHLNALALSNYNWNLKTTKKNEVPSFLISNEFEKEVLRSKVLVESTWIARDLIHTPSNIKSPNWIANESRKLAKANGLKIKVLSGKSLAKFGGLRAVGNSSKKNPPCFHTNLGALNELLMLC
jgi:leucyl aminopeptidase